MYGHTSPTKPEQGPLQTESHCQARPKLLRICRTGCTLQSGIRELHLNDKALIWLLRLGDFKGPGQRRVVVLRVWEAHSSPPFTRLLLLAHQGPAVIDIQATGSTKPTAEARLEYGVGTHYWLCGVLPPSLGLDVCPVLAVRRPARKPQVMMMVTSCSCHCQLGPLPLDLDLDLDLSPRRALLAGNPPPSCRLELPAATCSGSDVSSRHSPLPLRYARADPAVTDHRFRRQETLVTVASYQQSSPPSVAGWLRTAIQPVRIRHDCCVLHATFTVRASGPARF